MKCRLALGYLISVVLFHVKATHFSTKGKNFWRINDSFRHTSSFTYKVKGYGDIHFIVGFQQITERYEVAVRAYTGSKAFIRRHRKILAQKVLVQSLSNYMSFEQRWMSWDDGILAIGYGLTVGDRSTLSYKTDFRKLTLSALAVNAIYSKDIQYVIDNENIAYFFRRPTAVYDGVKSTLPTKKISLLQCAGACRETPRCAAISYKSKTKECKLVGQFNSSSKADGKYLFVIKQRG